MTALPTPLVEVRRGPFVESTHAGHAVICGPDGDILEAWGDPDLVMLPRSSAKMIQALPLITSGAAESHRLTDRQLALACASHEGAPLHVGAVSDWLEMLGLSADDLRCGPQPSRDKALRFGMIRSGEAPCQIHNNCSGKHTGFLTLARHLGANLDYIDPAHPVQKACLAAFEETSDETSPGFGIDGCSAPNFALTMTGMARAMAWFASASKRSDAQSAAAARLVGAMHSYPEMVAGEGRACTLLMRAATEPLALKTGAEGYFTAILPQRGLGLALKIADGATRASECATAALLVRLGVLDPAHPDVQRFLNPPVLNRRDIVTGDIRPVAGLTGA